MNETARLHNLQIGVLGGTFDPIHLAHLRLAEEAREQLGLDKVLFMPAPLPWRKAGRAITAVEHRLAMVRLAIAGNSFFALSTLELEHDGPTYTANTLAALQQQFAIERTEDRRTDTTLHFILGADALLDLPNWHEPRQIVALARLAVIARAGAPLPDLAALDLLVPSVSTVVERVVMSALEISSTDIRFRAAHGQSLRYLLPPAVLDYIQEHHLYTDGDAPEHGDPSGGTVRNWPFA